MLSHPLIVEAAETLFVPVAIRNNTEGDAEAEVRAAFREPAWNNPVVRLLGDDDKDLVPRLADEWSLAQLVDGMVQARRKAKLDAPPWLTALRDEAVARRRGLERAVFAMG